MSAGTRQPCLSLSVHPKSTPATTSRSSRVRLITESFRHVAVSPRGPFVFVLSLDGNLHEWPNTSGASAIRTFGKYFASESEEVSFGIAPSSARQPGFPAGLLEKLFARQPVFDRHLGKKKPALRVEADEESMTPDFDGFREDWFHS